MIISLKDRIIEISMKMFADEGIKSVRMDDIASRCGISKRTLYETFSDRECLITESIEYFVEKYENMIKERLGKAENIIDEFWIVTSCGSAFRKTSTSLMTDLVKFYPNIFENFIRKHHAEVVESNRERLERGQRDGWILKNINCEFMARNLSNYIYGMNRNIEELYHAVNEENDLERVFEFTIMLFFRGITTEAGRKYIDGKILVGLE